MTYAIIRFYKDCRPNAVIRRGLTETEARKHCTDPRTSTPEHFDGYTIDTNPRLEIPDSKKLPLPDEPQF